MPFCIDATDSRPNFLVNKSFFIARLSASCRVSGLSMNIAGRYGAYGKGDFCIIPWFTFPEQGGEFHSIRSAGV